MRWLSKTHKNRFWKQSRYRTLFLFLIVNVFDFTYDIATLLAHVESCWSWLFFCFWIINKKKRKKTKTIFKVHSEYHKQIQNSATSKMQPFLKIVKVFQPLKTKNIWKVVELLDPPVSTLSKRIRERNT